MQVQFINIWKRAEGLGVSSFRFRIVAYLSAIILILVHHIERGLPISFLEIITVLIFFIVPHFFLYRYVVFDGTLSTVIRDSMYDFFFAGWFMGMMNLCIVPSVVFGMGAITNYLAMRGYKKLYRVLLMPLGCLIVLSIEGFEFHFESSNLILFLALTYSILHYLINSYILYYSGSTVRLKNIEIERQRKEIEEKSEELRRLNESLHAINAELELKVRNRTRELEVKNRKLEEYTFMNAHKLRAPIATILGLIHLLNFQESIKDDEILNGLKKTAIELDDAIRGIREKLEAEDVNQSNFL